MLHASIKHRIRRRPLAIAGVLALLAMCLAPMANAATTRPTITLSVIQPGIVKVTATHFTAGATAKTVARSATGAGARSDKVPAGGSFAVGFRFNPSYSGAISVVTTAGTAQAKASIKVSAGSGSASAGAIPLKLYNDTTPGLGDAIGNISDGQSIDLSSVHSPNIWAFPSSKAKSMKFCLDNTPCRVEKNAPFAMYDDEATSPWQPAKGQHTLKASAYSTADATGTPIASTQIRFLVGSGGGSTTPAPKPQPGTTPPPAPTPSTTPPPPVTPQATSIIPTSAKLQFTGDFDTGDISQWDTELAQDYSLTVKDGGSGHTTAGRFELRDGDTPVDSGERAEVKNKSINVVEGDERWYSFSMMIDKEFAPQTGWCVLFQQHGANSDGSAAEGSPALAIECKDGNISLLVNDENRTTIGPMDQGVWHDYVMHVKYSSNAGTAYEEVWRDGKSVIAKGSHGPNLTTPTAYLKTGLYRDPKTSGTQVVWSDGFKVYTS